MTFAHLKATLLEGAPSDEEAKQAEEAMRHYSYTSLSYRITNMLKQSSLKPAEQEDLVVSFSLNFYLHDLARYQRTGTFEKNKI